MVLYILSNLGDCLNFIGFVLALPQAFAEDRPASAVDLGMSKFHVQFGRLFGYLAGASHLPLVSRYRPRQRRWSGGR